MLAKTAGTVRYCYNWGLSKWNELYKQGEKCDQYLLSRLWTSERPVWSKDVFRGAQTRALLNLGGAFSAFFRGQRRHPTFHKKGREDSFYVTNDKPRIKGNFKISIPNVGVVHMAEKLRLNGRILGYTVSCIASDWYVSVHVCTPEQEVLENRSSVGIDVGSKHWAVTSDGEVLDRPAAIPTLEKKLKRAQRSLSRKQKGSRNRNRARLRVARIHRRIHCVKMDAVHKFTSRIAKNHGVICCENLCVSGMGKSAKSIRKAVHNSCLSELRRVLAYKAQHYVEIDRFYPSSKRCSKCGHVKDGIGLSERTYRCESCGSVLDRDYNAAINIRDEGLRVFTEGHSGSACGGR